MLLLSQGCCFIQSLLFSYVLQDDSVKFSRKFISVPYQPSGRRGIPSGRSSVSNICPNAFQSSRRFQCSSETVQTTWLYCPDANHCLTSIRVSTSRHSYGKTATTVRTMCDPVRTMSSIR